MKKNLFLLFALAIAITSCKKDNDVSVASSNNESAQKAISPQMQFTKKVLVEEFTGCTYGNAPYSDFLLNHEITSNSNRIYRASMHMSDMMQTNQSMIMYNKFCNGNAANNTCALVNRTGTTGSRMINTSQYHRYINSALQSTARCGIALSSAMSGSLITVETRTQFSGPVNCSFSTTVYLVHENITSSVINYAQANLYNNSPNNPLYGRGNPITPYTHQDVVFKVMSPANGSHVNASEEMTTGPIFTQTFNCDVSPNMIGNDCYVIAFVTNAATGEVMNVQKVKLGSDKSWD